MTGDSITRGYDCTSTTTDTVYNGYRSALDTLAIADGYTSIQWLGQQNNSTASYAPTRHHEGINGDSCNDKLPGAPSTNGSGFTTNTITNYLGTGKPLHGVQVIMLNLGTNAEDSGSFAANYQSLIEQIHSREPQARFVVNTVFSGTAPAANNTSLTTTRTGVWDTLGEEGIQLYRATTTLVGGDLCDGIHPTPTGYTKLGNDIYPALRSALRGL
ncbi:MAG TPA: SGNH/GDSL hydrolase family protein [Polyangiaceae bacterium]|jgi:lysophospholipase L1-like esterase|nr:SGNH/GDSL hydrolase family protein [Polyangiaceae bacterium]